MGANRWRSALDYNARMAEATLDFFCSIESQEAQEDLAGSAPRADVWFLLEYNGKWGKAALKESSIPEDVKIHLDAMLATVPKSRLLLIKNRQARQGIAFFAALAAEDPPALYEFSLESYRDLLALDLAALAEQDPAFDAQRSKQTLFVVCTNGLRDRCCAVHGLVAYQTLAAEVPGQVWESTHHGGHRFAANLLQMPQGLSYGRLRAEPARALLASAGRGELLLEHLRGRSRFGEPQQAAEILLRRLLNVAADEGLTFVDSQELGSDRWKMHFSQQGQPHVVTVQRSATGRQVHLSCGDEATGPVVQYTLV